MTAVLDGDGNHEYIAAALRDAATDLEQLIAGHRVIADEFESHGWVGLDALEVAGTQLAAVIDSLSTVAERVGVGGQIVADAHTTHHMIGRASKTSLGHT
ncbi:hypothetical protein Ae717Ps2_5923c [Pseudonocardia sp. Ae717_Ps2]|uniref:hypothetical protein n=1 Tax=Pseudonocardia sp. Ae717_Ps2 TaxID=1885573 RepID=UPI00095E37A0|nr:hypothetical protein [Pseudonocardia sp. Ae717_Ps2]OLM28954.1 hypothetical protein Ae717Ps2_5878c [Pseudonocardia sp. Ae717_Ps2]OLM28999.1 hypothetical protein Ae717Ps2_5923c [Pseudonocardia sp. Ae717_Ps2]